MTEPPDPHIQAFGSMEEVFAWMAEHEQQAINDALPEQWAITWGNRVFRIAGELAIYGEVYTEEEFLQLEEFTEEDLDEETTYELDMLRDAHRRGYRYGRWYSVVVPDGEYGSSHVVNLWPITPEEFEEARAKGWLYPTLVFRVGQRVGLAYQAHRARQADGEEG